MVTTPPEMPVIIPPVSMVAMPVLLLLQVPPIVVLSIRYSVLPTHTVPVAGTICANDAREKMIARDVRRNRFIKFSF